MYMIKNIIFDVGRVLVSWQPQETMRKLGMTETDIEAVSDALFTSGLWNETDRGVQPDEEILKQFIERAPKQEKNIRLFWNNLDVAITQFDYVISWMKALKKAGYRLYILSNYGKWTYDSTKDNALSFLSEVDGALFSYEVKLIKPDLEIYRTLLRKFDLKPEECVFMDDLEANIKGAQAVGINGIVFKNQKDAIEQLKKYGVTCEM